LREVLKKKLDELAILKKELGTVIEDYKDKKSDFEKYFNDSQKIR